MRQFVTEDGKSGAEATSDVSRKGGTDGHAVGEIVESVTHDNHPCHRRHGLRGRVHMTVRVRVAVVRVLMLSEDKMSI